MAKLCRRARVGQVSLVTGLHLRSQTGGSPRGDLYAGHRARGHDNSNLITPYHSEATWDVRSEDAGLDRLHMTAHIRLRVKYVTVVCQLVEDGLLLVWEDDVSVEGLDHKQGLTQGA